MGSIKKSTIEDIREMADGLESSAKFARDLNEATRSIAQTAEGLRVSGGQGGGGGGGRLVIEESIFGFRRNFDVLASRQRALEASNQQILEGIGQIGQGITSLQSREGSSTDRSNVVGGALGSELRRQGLA